MVMTNDNPASETIWVSRSELLQALQTLVLAVKKKTSPNLVVYCDSQTLCLRAGAVNCRIDGEGSFKGQGQLSGQIIQPLIRTLPKMDLILVQEFGEFLRFGDLKLSCHWEPLVGEQIRTVINAALMDNLSLLLQYSNSELQASGAEPVVKAAEEECDRRIAQAAEILKPLGIGIEDLQALIQKAVQKYSKGE
jgi:hypothetical protein